MFKVQKRLESLRNILTRWKCEECTMDLNEFYTSICHTCHAVDSNKKRNVMRDEMYRLEANIIKLQAEVIKQERMEI